MTNDARLPAGRTGELSFGSISLIFVKMIPGDELRGLVPSYHFRILTKEMADAGHINLRVGDTEHVRICAGHIGYEIHESFRGHSYALQACCALAPFIRSIYPSVIITADPGNHASIRTIERLGAVFMDEMPVPRHDPHYERGSRIKRRYRWTP